MSTETIKLKPKADVIAQFRYNAKVQAMGVFEANGMVSPHGHDATNREKRLPLIASDHPVPPFTQLNPEQGFSHVRSDVRRQHYKAAWELASHPATSARAGLRQRLHTGNRRPEAH
jgi:hypothetical protein